MSYQSYTAKIILTEKVPNFHTKQITDFNFYVKNNLISVDDFKKYFEEPFQDTTLKEIVISGDSLNIGIADGTINCSIDRKEFENEKILYRYAKVELTYDLKKTEFFYCWVTRQMIRETSLTKIDINLLLDLIPSFFDSIILQLFDVNITQRSMRIFKSSESYLKEREYRFERQKYNLSCSSRCQSEQFLYYRHHFKSQNKIEGLIIFDSELPEDFKKDGYFTNNEYPAYSPEFLGFEKQNVPINWSISPFFLTYNRILKIKKDGSTTENESFNNFDDLFLKQRNWYGQFLLDQIRKQVPNVNFYRYLFICLYENKNNLINNFNLNIFENESEKFKYNDFKNNIPLHFQEFHTKYMIIANQDSINEIPINQIFYDGFNLDKSIKENKWIDDVLISICQRLLPTTTYYDVFYWNFTKELINPKKEFNQNNIQPLLSFETIIKFYIQETDFNAFLRANPDREKIAKQEDIKNFLIRSLGLIGGGVVGGAKIGVKIGSVGGGLGAFLGLTLGALIAVGTQIYNRTNLLDSSGQLETQKQELKNSFKPALTSDVGGNYISFIFENEEKIMHPLGIYCLEITSFGWEWKYNFTDYKNYGIHSQKLLNNLINYGENCDYLVNNFNLFNYVLKNRTDQNIFYIKISQGVSSNQIFYSNIFYNVDNTLILLLIAGIRFHFIDIEDEKKEVKNESKGNN